MRHPLIRRAVTRLLAAATLCTSGAAWAAPISYAEGVDLRPNSIADSPSFTHLGSLDVGSNQVSGGVNCASVLTSSFRCDGDEADFFRVTLPAGLQITAVQIVVSAFQGSAGVSAYSGVLGGPTLLDSLGAIDLFGNGSHGFTGATGAAPGTLAFFTSVFPAQASFPYAGSYQYTWTIDVARQVPEPSGLAVLAGALMLLATRGRRAR